MKKVLSSLLVCALVIGVCTFSAYAASTANFIIDNDTVDKTCTVFRDGFDIYVTGSSHYNGDCRRQLSSNKYAYYEWRKKSKTDAVYSYDAPIYVTAGVYLRNSLFTDTQAHYYLEQEDGSYLINIINQKTAREGWTYFDATINLNYATPNTFSVYGMSLSPSGIGSGYTGADAISIVAEAG